jgi:uncharacterized protein (TIGR03790 family)
VPETNGVPGHMEWRPTESKIRYAVLCYGVPLFIREDKTVVEPVDKLRPELRRNEAAVDSELAWLPYIEQGLPLVGALNNPAYTLTNAALIHPTNGILMVARLDGPTPEIARGLVDKALEAEANGLWGRGYFDLRGATDVGYKTGDDQMLAAAQITVLSGYQISMDTNAPTWNASFPMSQIAFYCGWYDNDVSGPFTLPHVEFMPGAFAYHLHSLGGATVRSATSHWVGPLLADGVTCTMGCTAEPYLQFMPNMGVFFGRFIIYGFTFGEAAWSSQNCLSWQTTVVGDPLYRPFGRGPVELNTQLEAQHSPLLEWSYAKLINLNLLKRVPVATLADSLEATPVTTNSAVLTEKLADLYAALGKPMSSVRNLEAALQRHPSPQQRIRIRLELGDRLPAIERDADAVGNYRKLLEENPDYAGKKTINDKIAELTAKLNSVNSAATNSATAK